jgi:hypothetical protein
MILTLAAKKQGDNWKAATVLDNKFQDAFVEPTLGTILGESLGMILGQVYADGTTVTVTVEVVDAEF